jgi:predicted XRE-type DNA-binding protein
MSDRTGYTLGSDNVFADLEYPNPEEALLKAKLAHEINTAFQERKLTLDEASVILGMDPPSTSDILRGRLSGFPVERLLRCLTALERDVTITVGPKKRDRGYIDLVSVT